jgi:transposase
MDVSLLAQRIDELEQRQDEAARALAEAQAERDAYHELYLQMMERCRKLERGLMGQASERRRDDGAQMSFDVLSAMISERDKAAIEALAKQAELETVREHKRHKPTGRRPLPEDLPRVDIEVIPDEVQRAGLDAFETIGREITEVIERRPASLVVARVIKPKFVRKDRDKTDTRVLVGSTPALPIERGLAGPGMLADTLVRRWQDHLPLHRLEGVYARDGIELARSTMCTWHEQLATFAEPLIAAMRADAFAQPFLCTDATGVLVQAAKKCRRAHFWVLVAPGRHVLFEYTRDHSNDAVDSILAGYEGYLVADAHVVYDHLYEDGSVVEVNCWSHARRYFFKALESEPERARTALDILGPLFKIERAIKSAPRKKREKIRAKHSAPVVERFLSWCDEQWPTLLEDTPLYDGVRYVRNQREGLQRFLDDGRLPLTNNISERELRRQAVGRKNWMFVGSDDGARANAVFTSLLASCRMLGIEPWAYLRDILCLLRDWPRHALLELAPCNWAKTCARDDVKAKLDADPFRAITLDRG